MNLLNIPLSVVATAVIAERGAVVFVDVIAEVFVIVVEVVPRASVAVGAAVNSAAAAAGASAVKPANLLRHGGGQARYRVQLVRRKLRRTVRKRGRTPLRAGENQSAHQLMHCLEAIEEDRGACCRQQNVVAGAFNLGDSGVSPFFHSATQ